MMLNKENYNRHKRIVKTQNAVRYINVFLFFCVLSLSVVLIYNLDFNFGRVSISELVETEAYLNGPQCENMTFQNTAICLNDFARSNFYYNITDDSIDLTAQDMMERGGDCRDWTNFYQDYMEYYGFDDNKPIKIFVSREGITSYYHVFLIASHSSGYCHMDIKDLQCYKYANDKGEIKD